MITTFRKRLKQIALIIFILLVFFLIRVDSVLKERDYIIDKIQIAGIDDILHERDWHWRIEEYNKISIDEMIWKFWIPVDSFYENNDCIKQGPHNGNEKPHHIQKNSRRDAEGFRIC